MIIFHIIIGLEVGGAELMLKRLIESHQNNHSYSHAVISLTSIGPVGLHLQSLGIVVHSLGLRSIWSVPRVLFRLVRIIRCARPDIVQTWMYHADLIGGIASRLAGVRNVIWGIRTTDVTSGGKASTALIRFLCARLSRYVPNTIVCAAHSSRLVHIGIGYDAKRMVVVPNGFELSKLTATNAERDNLRHQCKFLAADLVIGFLGRFHPVKNQANFVSAAAMIAELHSDVRFLMVGRDCDTANVALMGWIVATGHAHRFVLLGERSDVPVCLAVMDVFCLSSRTEGFPNVLGEAMGMQRVCVTTDVGDAAYLLGGCGVVVSKDDAASLAQGIAKLVGLSAENRALLGERARARIESEFSMDRTCKRFEAIYTNVLASQPQKRVFKK